MSEDISLQITLDDITLDGFEIKVHGKHGLVPKQAEPGSAGYDLYTPPSDDIHLPFGCRRMLDTGVIVQTPIRLFMLMVPRSSTGTKRAKSVRIANTVGVIDPSYQGKDDTIKVCLERESRKMDYVGSFEYQPSTVRSDRKSQAAHKFGVSMSPEETKLVNVGGEHYDVYTHTETEDETLIFKAGTRFAQVIFIPYARPDLVEAALEEFGDDRGGFGSTGS